MRRALTAPCLATLLPRRHLILTTTTEAAVLARSLSLVPVRPPLGNSDRLAVWMPILRPECTYHSRYDWSDSRSAREKSLFKMTLTFASTKHRYSVHDVLLDTSVDGVLYKGGIGSDNNNIIESFFYNTDEIAYLNPMAVGTANGVAYDGSRSEDRRTVIRENRISHHLTNNERGSILAYLEPSAKALCTGVCQLLQAENDIWTDMKVGVICFIRDPHVKEYALTLLLPKSDERFPAKVLWTMNVSAFFETERTSDEHLLTFVMESYPRDICGLNFYDPQEADEFHRILVDENRGRISRRAGKPKRQAPPPPPSQTSGLEAIERLTELSMATPNEDVDKKQHRKSFLGGLFTMKRKKKKENKKLDISAPSDFQHVEHLGLEQLSLEDQETFHHLIKAVDIQPGNEAQMQLIREIVATRGSEVRSSIRLKRNSIRPSGETFVRGSAGGAHNSLADSRNSMMVVHKQQRRTPREVKKGSFTKRHDSESPPQHQPAAPLKEIPVDQYLNPDWGSAAPSYGYPTNLHVITEAQAAPKATHTGTSSWSPEAPPIPSRTESMAPRRSPVGRRKTPPYLPAYRLPPPSGQAPRLPDRQKVEQEPTGPIWRIEIPLPSGAQAPSHSPPPTPPSSQPSPVPNPSAATASSHAQLTSSDRPAATVAVGPAYAAAPPPPPPPPGLLSPAPTPPPCADVKQRLSDNSPPISHDRRSFLEEIQNLDKARLRHVDQNEQSRALTNGDSPTGDGGLLSAIQAELDKRREYIATDSDEESDSTDSEWTD